MKPNETEIHIRAISHFLTNRDEIISQFQIERDQATIELLLLKERFEKQRKLTLLNEYVDFNAPIVLPLLIPLFINNQAIDFLLKNHHEIRRKFTITELIEFGSMYRLVKQLHGEVKTLKELRKKHSYIKPISKVFI